MKGSIKPNLVAEKLASTVFNFNIYITYQGRTMKKQLILLSIGVTFFSAPAFAYIDPGMGSIIVQGLIGAFAVIGGAWFTLKQKFYSLFSRKKDVNNKDAKK
jgi:hypothetical protein